MAALFEKIQGDSFTFNVDATNFGTIDGLLIEIGQNNSAKVKFKWPDTDGYEKLTKVGDVYTAAMTTAITELLLGMYDLEVTRILNGQENGKKIIQEFMLISKQIA